MGLGALVAGIVGNYYVQNQTTGLMDMSKPWVGLDCDEMLDFSGSDKHQDLTMDQHMEFHQYYMDKCSKTEQAIP